MCQYFIRFYWLTPENEDSFIGNSAVLGYNFCKRIEDDGNSLMGTLDTYGVFCCLGNIAIKIDVILELSLARK